MTLEQAEKAETGTFKGQRPNRTTDEIYARCREVIVPGMSFIERRRRMEDLEAAVAALDTHSLRHVLADDDCNAIRPAVIAEYADVWYRYECDLAKAALGSGDACPLDSLFETHAPLSSYRKEIATLKSVSPDRLLIIGSGPCPMSAYVFAKELPGCKIVCADRSEVACNLSKALFEKSGLFDIEVQLEDASRMRNIHAFDCVLLALTVGDTPTESAGIVRSLARTAMPDATLLARTAIGWGEFFYRKIGIPELNPVHDDVFIETGDIRSTVLPTKFSEIPA